MALIITHKNADMDAVVSAHILKEFLEHSGERVNIIFRSVYDLKQFTPPANEPVYIVDMKADVPNAIILDHHDVESQRHKVSAVNKVVDYIASIDTSMGLYFEAVYKSLIEEARREDYLEDIHDNTPLKPRDFFIAMKMSVESDDKLYEIISPIFEFIKAREISRMQAVEWFNENGKVVKVGKYSVAVMERDTPAAIGEYVFTELGVDLMVFSGEKNIGITRNAVRTEPDLRNLKPFIEEMAPQESKEWFFHPAGFLAARGTRKNPAPTPSVLSADDILKALANMQKELNQKVEKIECQESKKQGMTL